MKQHTSTNAPKNQSNGLRLVVNNGPKVKQKASAKPQAKSASNESDFVMVLAGIETIREAAKGIPNRAIQNSFNELCDKHSVSYLSGFFGGAA